MKELIFQLLSRLGLEPPPNEGQNPIARVLRTDPYTPGDEPYLRQYLGVPKKGGLIPTDLRPSRLDIKDNLPWYRLSSNPVKSLEGITDAQVEGLRIGDILELPQAPPVPGLGHYTASVAKGTSGQPFLSVYDKWDFESPVISPLMKSIMDKVGKGFHLYERYPLTKSSRGYYAPAENIELPNEDKLQSILINRERNK